MFSHRRVVSFALLLFTATGCGPGETGGRVEISGLVTIDGRPLDEATITLIPEARGPAASGAIRGGEFRLGRSEGPVAGPYRVEIDAVRPTGKVIEHPDLPGDTIEETENIVPPAFNRASTLRVEVAAGGDNRFEFAVNTR